MEIQNALTTVGQVSGAILGFGGAVIVFKLESIRNSIYNYRNRVIDHVLSIYKQDDPTSYYGLKHEVVISQFEKEKNKIIDENRKEVSDENVRKHIVELYGIIGYTTIKANPYKFVVGSYQTYKKINEKRLQIRSRFISSIILLSISLVFSIVFPVYFFNSSILTIWFIISSTCIAVAVYLFSKILLTEVIEN
ncbi:MAG: hypothetical protein WCV50_03020 [Patescibacteria group bacterium]|jgi:hypothetical protein